MEIEQKGFNIMKKTYLFDFDGTLVDSMPTFVSVMLRILDENQVKYGSDIVKIITPLGYRGTAEYFRKLGIDESVESLVAKMNRYAKEEYTYRIMAKESVVDTLRALKERGADLNVLTASPHDALDPCLKRIGIWDLFTNVWSCDDFENTKADPDIYKSAAKKIGECVENIIFIDDNVGAVKTAKLAGMMAYGIYDPSSSEYIDEMKAISDRYIVKLSELL
ncbi:MAG: HAD family hydrolase [Ruminococcaceae bacterium]|nr:HAD family hydrolase [Oscillospiraceae bacterium]